MDFQLMKIQLILALTANFSVAFGSDTRNLSLSNASSYDSLLDLLTTDEYDHQRSRTDEYPDFDIFFGPFDSLPFDPVEDEQLNSNSNSNSNSKSNYLIFMEQEQDSSIQAICSDENVCIKASSSNSDTGTGTEFNPASSAHDHSLDSTSDSCDEPKRKLTALESDPSLPENETVLIPKRSKFCSRVPFFYRTDCNCYSKYFSYIRTATKHMDRLHNHSGDSYNNVIQLIDDFGVAQGYPFVCELCPFRTRKSVYLTNHIDNIHGVKI